MSLKHSSLNDANSPGIASEQGVATWNTGDDSLVEAVTDVVYVQPGYYVVVYPLLNDIGENLSITAATLRDPAHGELEFDAETVTFTPAAGYYDSLECGESLAVTIDYSIADLNGNTDDGFIVANVINQSWFWADEVDGTPILNEDETFIALCGEIVFEWWVDEVNDTVLIDEDGTPLISEI